MENSPKPGKALCRQICIHLLGNLGSALTPELSRLALGWSRPWPLSRHVHGLPSYGEQEEVGWAVLGHTSRLRCREAVLHSSSRGNLRSYFCR